MMGVFKKADFYYGALLSVLLNNGMKPALFGKEDHDSRRRYTVMTDHGEYEFYCKYMTTPSGKDEYTWPFTFSENECKEIDSLLNTNKTIVFAFICSQKELANSQQEIALVFKEEFKKCVSLDTYKNSSPRLSISVMKFSNYLRIYGNSRSDILDGKDNTIKIERNRIKSL